MLYSFLSHSCFIPLSPEIHHFYIFPSLRESLYPHLSRSHSSSLFHPFLPPWWSRSWLFLPFLLIYVNNREIFHDFWKIFLQRFVCLYKTLYLCIRFWEILLLSDIESVLWETERQKSSTGVAWVDLGDNTSEATVAGRKACWYFFRGGFDFNLILGWHSEKQTDSGIPSDTYIIKTFLQFPEQREEWELAFIPESWRKCIRYLYNGEFDPGSGWTLATGLTHASRGAALR